MTSWLKYDHEIKKMIIYVIVMLIYVNNKEKIFFWNVNFMLMLNFMFMPNFSEKKRYFKKLSYKTEPIPECFILDDEEIDKLSRLYF